MTLKHPDAPHPGAPAPPSTARGHPTTRTATKTGAGTARKPSPASAPLPDGGSGGRAARLDPYVARALTAAINLAAERGGGEVAAAEVKRLRQLAENARSLLRLLSGSEPLRAAPLDLGDLLMALLPPWNRSAPRHSFELALLGEIPTVIVDAERVERALDRLLAIAVGMTPEGGTVRVSVRPHADEVVVSVRHYGSVPPWARGAELFDLGDPGAEDISEDIPDERAALNAALDLTLARAIVEWHGGRAWTERAGAEQSQNGLALLTAWPLVPRAEPADGSPPLPGAAPAERSEHSAPLVARERPVALVVEADARMGRFLRANLEAQGVRALTACEAGAARRLVDLEAPDLVLLDGGLAASENFALLRRLLADAECPIIVLARQSDPLACAHALDLGAADWIARPFSVEELLARLRAALRRRDSRALAASEPSVTCGELTIDFAQRLVSVAGAAVALSKTEYKLLRALAQHPGMALSHDTLLERVWGPGYGDAVEFLWVYVRRLRRKIEPDPARPRYILTIPGVGYRLARG